MSLIGLLADVSRDPALHSTIEAARRGLDPHLDLVARGHDNLTISRRLVLSPKTVRNVVSNVLTKLAVRDRAAAIVLARDHGLGLD